jgi:predicted amino acid racemase
LFLDAVLRRNPGLARTALTLHRTGRIPPNTFVVDQEALSANAARIADTAARLGIRLYFMSKQIGHNPLLVRSVARAIPDAVAVCWDEALALCAAGVRVSHVGHLVQPPNSALDRLIQMAPEVVTVYSIDKARALSEAATRAGRVQSVLLRVAAPGDVQFPGQLAGFAIADLVRAADTIASLDGVRVAGVTSFPCVTWDRHAHAAVPTPNLGTLTTAAQMLRRDLGLTIDQINAPGMTACSSLPILAEHGATHGEPGHALTGTTPANADGDAAEVPAAVYVTEISHFYGARAYFPGGGLYSRGRIRRALVARDAEGTLPPPRRAAGAPVGHIDYHGSVTPNQGDDMRVGDTVVLAFRMQMFVSRAYVAVVRGVDGNHPELIGLFDSNSQLCEPDGSRNGVTQMAQSV